jgi:hypothetical protein
MQSERRLLQNRITRLSGMIPGIADDELRAELTKHLCVLSSGFVEVACRDILERYAVKRSAPTIRRFVSSRLSDFQNPKVGKIYELFGAFDPVLATTWLEALSDEQAGAIDSIVSNRHQITHGRSVGLSFDVWNRYYKRTLEALTGIESYFTPNE